MTRERALDESWKGWLKENMERGCSRTELVDILRKHGFSLSSIKENMGEAFPEDDPVSRSEPLPLPRLVRSPPPKLQKVDTDAVDLYTLDDFLSAKECDRVVALINHHLRPSTVTVENTEK